MSSPVVSASPATDRRLRGYGEIAAASLIVVAGLLVVLFGEHEEEGATSLEPAP